MEQAHFVTCWHIIHRVHLWAGLEHSVSYPLFCSLSKLLESKEKQHLLSIYYLLEAFYMPTDCILRNALH